MPKLVHLLGKFWRLSWQDRLLLLEATAWLTIAGVFIAVLPFRHVGRLAARPIGLHGPELPHHHVWRIRWAIITTAARLPVRALCFQQGLAAHLMLRRRGIPSVLYYGAALEDQRLSAHVWVRDRDADVIGGEIASRYAVLTAFPPQRES